MMKSKSLLLLVVSALAWCVTSPALAQRKDLGSPRDVSVVALPGAGFVGFVLEAVPSSGGKSLSFVPAQEAEGLFKTQALYDERRGVIRRLLVDVAGNLAFGYQLAVEMNEATRAFNVTVGPLDADFERRLKVRSAFVKRGGSSSTPDAALRTLPRTAPAQMLADGDGFTLDLLINEAAGVKIVDVVRVSFARERFGDAPVPANVPPARDFTLASVELSAARHTLRVNGEAVWEGRGARGLAGPLLWFHVPGRGRYVLSLMPREGYAFEKVGVVEDERVTFTHGGDRFEWVSAAPFVGQSRGRWHLWVLHDPAYVPESFDPARERVVASDWPDREALQEAERARQSRQSGLQTSARAGERGGARRPRPTFGAADRMENLLPR